MMDSSQIKFVSGGKIVHNSDLRRGQCKKIPRNDQICRMGTWNVRSLKRTGKLENVKKEMDRLEIDVLGLSEVRWPNNGDFWSGDYRIIYSGDAEGTGGVGFILKRKLAYQVKSIWGFSERIIMITLRTEPKDTVLIQTYMPTSSYSDDEVEDIYEQLEEVLMKVKEDDNLIIMGDWNAVVGEGTVDNCVGKYGLGNMNARGNRLIEFCRSHTLIVANTCFEQPKRRRYTWTMPGNGDRYQIDYILVKSRYRNQAKSCKSYPGADVDSDHNLVLMKSQLRLRKKVIKQPCKRWNTNKVKNDKQALQKFREETNARIGLQKMSENIQERWDKTKKVITETAEACFGKQDKTVYKPWITGELLDLMEERRKCKARGNHEEYARLRNKINKEAKRVREEWYEKKCKDIDEHLAKGNSERAYAEIRKQFGTRRNMMNVIRSKNGEALTEDDEIALRWKEYTEELYEGVLDANVLESEDQVDVDELGPLILREEFDRALKELRHRKAPGPDGIPAEILQALGDKAKDNLYNLINEIYVTGEIPKDFEQTILIPIPKKHRAQRCEDHRTLSLLSHASKIITRIIYHRIERKAEDIISEEQFGFRKGRGTREAILSLRLIIEKSLEIDKLVVIAFIDLEKAFDNVNWKVLFETLRKLKIDYRDRRILYQLYKNQTALIGKERVEARIGKGVRQGCGLSPLLFNIYIEEAIQEFLATNSHGIKVNGKLYSTIRFADDIALITENERDMENALNHINKLLQEKCGMRINKKKTKVMACTRDGDQFVHVLMDGEKLTQVKEFKYLGSLMTSNGKCTREVNARIAQAKEAFSKKKSLLTSKTVSLEVRKHLVKSSANDGSGPCDKQMVQNLEHSRCCDDY